MDLTAAKFIVGVTALLVIAASVNDLKMRKIPNALVLSGILLGVTLNSLANGWQGFGASLVGLGAGLVVMLPGYLLRCTGGGDVKLVAAVGSLLGAKLLFVAFVITALVAGLWALLQGTLAWARRGALLPFGRYGAMLTFFIASKRLTYIEPDEKEVAALRIPLAPAIAVGSIAAPLLFG